MAIIKCKMCGGDIELTADKTFGTCEFCGSTMTLPKIDDDQRAAAFNRGNHFRRIGEFDKALAVYERIVREDDTDAEAHWCCALCRFGIEYVEDPATYEWMPTCHRASFDSFLEDIDYLAAVEHSEGITRRQYQKDAAKIAEVQRGILSASQNAEPYDVFICYKESDANGQRTRDSLLAQDIYYQLTEQGRKVFFARITLEDVAGAQYEPYIFAALNSAKVMVVVGTKAEYLNAVWVKNEWSRFLAMMKKDRHKLLLPCYRDMDPYDMPEQLSILQSYDMSKIGFLQDLTRGIAKVLDADKKPEPAKETVVVQQAPASNVEPLLRRVTLFLEEGNWDSATEYCERVLDIEPENAQAYLGKLMSELKVRKQEDLKNCEKPFNDTLNYKNAVRFGDAALKNALTGYLDHINARNTEAAYRRACNIMESAAQKADRKEAARAYDEAAGIFDSLGTYKNAADQAKACTDCRRKIGEEERKQAEDRIKCETLVKELKQYYQTEAERVVRREETAGAVDFLRALVNNLEVLKNDWSGIEKELHSLQEKKCDLRKEIARLTEEKDRLSFFQGKKKREMEAQINSLSAEADALDQKIETASQKKQGYSSLEAVCAAYDDLRKKLEEQETTLAQLCAPARTEDMIRTELRESDYGRTLLEKQEFQPTSEVVSKRQYTNVYYLRMLKLLNKKYHRDTIISAGDRHTVGLKSDGTVVATRYTGDDNNGQCDVSGWRDIAAVAAGERHTVGLKYDGTVVATEYTGLSSLYHGQCDVSGWRDIVAIAAGGNHTAGLKYDGTVVAVGFNGYKQCDVSGWRNIVAIAAGNEHTVGLKSDGTVVATEYTGHSAFNYGQCDVSGWRDIVAIAAGFAHTVGLKSDGTVVAVGDNSNRRCDVSGWRDIVAIAAGSSHTVGLKSDGTVVATKYTGQNDVGQCDVSGWSDIVAIAASFGHTVGLKSDGTVVATKYTGSSWFYHGQCDVSRWRRMKLPSLDSEP